MFFRRKGSFNFNFIAASITLYFIFSLVTNYTLEYKVTSILYVKPITVHLDCLLLYEIDLQHLSHNTIEDFLLLSLTPRLTLFSPASLGDWGLHLLGTNFNLQFKMSTRRLSYKKDAIVLPKYYS